MKQVKTLPMSMQQQLGPPKLLESFTNALLYNHISKSMKDYLYHWLCYWTENYISNLDTSLEKFDLILCLGTVKWIHLNFGDIGVKALFLKSFESLEKGGIYVLEA